MANPTTNSSSLFPNFDLPPHRGLVLVFILNAIFFGSAFLTIFSISGAVPLVVNLIISLYLIVKRERGIGHCHVFLVGLIILTTCLQIYIWSDWSYFKYSAFLVSSISVVMLASRADIEKTIDAISLISLVVLLLASISFVLVYLGAEPLITFENRDGRPLYVFPSTLSNSYQMSANIVRPSGIFDEPGALSFFICSIACLRTIIGKSERLTWALLGLGLVTLSLAHIIYMAIHFIAVARLRNHLTMAPVLSVLAILAVVTSGIGDIFYEKLVLRFDMTEGSGVIAGDNRTARITGALDIIESDNRILFLGIGPNCIENVHDCEGNVPAFAAAPLEPLVLLGFLQGWPYYLLLVVLSFSPLLGRKYLVVFGFGLLLLQRPYVMHLGYSFYSILILFVFLGLAIDHFRSNAIGDS